MDIKAFKVEEWMNEYETDAKYNIAETCVDSVSLDELFDLAGVDASSFWQEMSAKRLTYGDIVGSDELKQGISSLYKTISPANIVPTHGAAGANHLIFYSMVNPGDRVVSIMPTYQQLYSIPEAYGADLQLLHLKQENNYLPDLEELKALVTPDTKMICINNPNNPTGALMSKELLQEIIDIAKSVDAYVLCDEVYRHLTQNDEWSPSVVDMYDKGISVSSMSKVFSLAGIRLGWIATHDEDVIKSCLSHRDYNLISLGMIDDKIGSIALRNKNALLNRSKSIVRENLAILDTFVTSNKHLRYTKPMAGTTALVYYDFDIPSEELCKDLFNKTGVLVTPSDCFEEEKGMRIGYACDKQELKDGLAKLGEYLDFLEVQNA